MNEMYSKSGLLVGYFEKMLMASKPDSLHLGVLHN